MKVTAARRSDDARLVALRKLGDREVYDACHEAGAVVTRIQAELDEAKRERMLLFHVLEERGLSYQRMADCAGGITDVAVMRGLQRHHQRRMFKNPPSEADSSVV